LADEKTRDHARRYLRVSGSEIGWDFIRAAYGAVSRLAVVTLPDVLSLGSEARFNLPGRPDGNWQWRYRAPQLDRLFDGTAGYLRDQADLDGRLPAPPEESAPK
jgi:4-alpha-glucanotransferase